MVGGVHFQDEVETAEETAARLRREETRLRNLRSVYRLGANAGEYAIAWARIKWLSRAIYGLTYSLFRRCFGLRL
jgi:hypothetical protein